LNRAQRIVLVLAWGAVLSVVAGSVLDRNPSGGWLGYAPQPREVLNYMGGRSDPIGAAIVWIAAIGLWAAGSLWLLADPDNDRP
jgi:hypothetical protein